MEKSQDKFKYKCPKHPEFNIEILQADYLDEIQKDKNLLYCSACVCKDSSFKTRNLLLIQQLIKSGTDEILSQWPPVNNEHLLQEIDKIVQEKDKTLSIIESIEKCFVDLKADVMKQIDICQKQVIQFTLEAQLQRTKILERYQELAKIQELRSVFVDQKSDILEKERQSRELVENIISQKEVIIEELNSLLNQFQTKQNNFNIVTILEMKSSFLDCIKNIKFFESNHVPIYNNNQIDSMSLDVQLLQTDFNNGRINTEITKNENNQYEVIVKKVSHQYNIVSDIILQRNKKYIFRIQILLMNEGNSCRIGLMRDRNINSSFGSSEYLSCILEFKNKQIQKQAKAYGIDNLIYGDYFKLSQENILEMRVCLQDKILEVLDYPNYHCKLALQDQYQDKLINQHFRLFLGINQSNNKMILKEAYTVEDFE